MTAGRTDTDRPMDLPSLFWRGGAREIRKPKQGDRGADKESMAIQPSTGSSTTASRTRPDAAASRSVETDSSDRAKGAQTVKAETTDPETAPSSRDRSTLEDADRRRRERRAAAASAEQHIRSRLDASTRPTSLLTEEIGDGHANCLEDAATMARPLRDEIVFMDDRRGATGGNANGAGHALVRDRATGRVWDPSDGPAPANPQAWTYRSVDAWNAAQGRAADGGPVYEPAGAVRADKVQDVLSVPPEQRERRIADIDDPVLSDVAPRLYADDPVDPVGERADALIRANSRRRGGHAGRNNPTPIINTENIAAEIVAVERTDPDTAAELRAAVEQRLPTGNVDALGEDIEQAQRYQTAAFRRLAGDLSGTVEVDQAAAEAQARTFIEQTTRTQTTGRGRSSRTYLDTNELAYQLERLSETDPALAVGTKLVLDGQLDAQQTADVNRLLGGGASIGENVNLALRHPGEIEGLLEGAANGFIEVGELFVRGSAMQSAGQQYQAAGMLALTGQDEQAERMIQSADEMMQAADDIELPRFELENRAQEGWATVGVAADLAFAGYGIVKGGVRLVTSADDVAEVVLRNGDDAVRGAAGAGDDAAEVVLRNADDVPPPTGRFVGRLDDLTPAERDFVEYALGRGDNIEVIPTGADRTPDFLINGVRTELKTVSGVADETADGISGAIANRVMNGRGQAEHIVVDVRGQAGISEAIAQRGIRRAFGADNLTGGKIQSIRIIGPGFDITVPRM